MIKYTGQTKLNNILAVTQLFHKKVLVCLITCEVKFRLDPIFVNASSVCIADSTLGFFPLQKAILCHYCFIIARIETNFED